MQNILNFLDGKKTYIVGLIMIAYGIYINDNQTILNGIAILTGRAAINKIQVQVASMNSPK